MNATEPFIAAQPSYIYCGQCGAFAFDPAGAPLSHECPPQPQLAFAAADARKALRVSARQKLTPEECEACGIAVAE